MDLNKLLSYIPEGLLNELALETGVDKYSKKLQGEVVFKLMLHCLISHKDNSLRRMESAYESIAFGLLNNGNNRSGIRYSSISERLGAINVSYFEKLYHTCVHTYKEFLSKEAENEIIRFDSTIVTVASSLINIGYQTGGDSLKVKQLKFTVGYSEIPEIISFYHEKNYSSENKALKETILKEPNNTSIRIFDRGITARTTYDEFTEGRIKYVSRIINSPRNEEYRPNCIVNPIQTKTLNIIEDKWVYLFGTNDKKTKHPVRLIRAIQLRNNEYISFVTNIDSLSANDITELYKRRWDIEVFFKFLKQHLNFSHIINRSENGIKVILYITMIAAILILVYKKQRKLTGFKLVKQKFAQELELEIVKILITLCGGDPIKLNTVLGKPPS